MTLASLTMNVSPFVTIETFRCKKIIHFV